MMVDNETATGRSLSVIRELSRKGVDDALMSYEAKTIIGVRDIRFTLSAADGMS